MTVVTEVDVADPPPWPQADVWLCWRGDLPLGALVKNGSVIVPLEAPPRQRTLPRISVVICTRDRPQLLQVTLAALVQQRFPADEIVVVDNASRTDETRLIAERSGVRYLREPIPGVRYARNRGLSAASGEVVAFIDDDCMPVRGWLGALRHAFASEPDAACCTGPVVAGEVKTTAQALMERRGGFCKGFERRCFAAQTHASPHNQFPLQSWMFGTGGNMAFRRDALIAAGGFAEDLPRGEDLDAFFRILRDGHALIYEPCAVVAHEHVAEYDTLRRRLFGWGYGYTAYLSRVAWEEPRYRRKALREIAGFIGYQLRERWWAVMRGRGDLPWDLVAAEVVGAFAGVPGYVRDRLRANAMRKSALNGTEEETSIH